MSAWPDRLNIDQYLLRDRIGEGRGSNIALRLDNRAVTYDELDQTVSRFGALLSAHGVAPGDRVLLLLPDGLSFVAALFGCFRIGAVAVMLNPGLKPAALAPIVSQSQAKLALLDAQYLDQYQEGTSHASDTPEVLVLSEAMELPHETIETFNTGARDPALWLFSGGTTGVPKIVVQSHRSFANTTKLYGQGSLGLTEKDITISVPKLYFGYATGSNLFFPLSVGASTILFPERSTPDALFQRIERHRASVLINVPSAINQMLNSPAAGSADLSSLRFATSAGEALPDTLYQRWVDRFGVEILDGLGTAEMWHIFVTNTLGDVRPGTVGRVVPGFHLRACDEEGLDVPDGEVGRLWVSGESLGLGYWKNPEASAEVFRDEWFVGSDLISIDGDGYVVHRGRADDAVKIKGKWFRPQEVESVLLEHPAVSEAAVIVVKDTANLPKPVAFVVATESVTEEALTEWVLDHLEAYKHPRRVYVVDKLPQTHLGKVDRGALRRLAT